MKNIIDLTPYLSSDVVLPQEKSRSRLRLSDLAEGIVGALLGCSILCAFVLFFSII